MKNLKCTLLNLLLLGLSCAVAWDGNKHSLCSYEKIVGNWVIHYNGDSVAVDSIFITVLLDKIGKHEAPFDNPKYRKQKLIAINELLKQR